MISQAYWLTFTACVASSFQFLVTLARAADPVIGSFLQHCMKCHGPEKQKDEVRLNKLLPPTASVEARKVWLRVADVLEAGEIPPPKEPRPDAAEITRGVHAIGSLLAQAEGERQPALGRRKPPRRCPGHTKDSGGSAMR